MLEKESAPQAGASGARRNDASPDAATKRLATARARAALAGVAVIESHDDRGHPTFIASRWALTREFASLDELERWLDQTTAGGRAA